MLFYRDLCVCFPGAQPGDHRGLYGDYCSLFVFLLIQPEDASHAAPLLLLLLLLVSSTTHRCGRYY